MSLELLNHITFVLKAIITILNIPILIIAIYATVIRVVESIYQLSTQPDVKSTWAKIIQTIKNFGSVETYQGG